LYIRSQSEEDGKGKYADSPEIKFNMISNDSQNTSQNMSQAQNSNTQMICQNNTTFEPKNDQRSLKDRDDTFASKDMTLVSMIGPTSIEYRDTTPTSVCPIVNQPPSENCTSTGVRDMTLASVVGLSPPKNCHTSTDVQLPSENCTSMGVQDMTLASVVGLSPSENCHTSMGVQDTTRISMVNQLPSENCTSMSVRDMTLASMAGMSPSGNNTLISVKDMTLASIVSQSPPKSMDNKNMSPTSMINRSPSVSVGDKDMTLTSMVNRSPSESMDDKLTPMIHRPPSDVKDMTLASMVDLSPSEIHKITLKLTGVNDITTASLEDHSIISSEDMSLVYEENVYQNDELQGSDINLQSSERRETTMFDVTDVSLINEVNVKLCDGTTAMLSNENIPSNTDIVINENINTGDLNIKECQKSDFADTEEMKFMKAMIEEQNQQIEIFEAELEDINKETQSLRELRDCLIKEKAEIEQVFKI
jgi:hypothetical protein